jgi:hypothetical protein
LVFLTAVIIIYCFSAPRAWFSQVMFPRFRTLRLASNCGIFWQWISGAGRWIRTDLAFLMASSTDDTSLPTARSASFIHFMIEGVEVVVSCP